MAQAAMEKLEETGPAIKERVASVPQSEQLASCLCQKKKEQSHKSRSPNREMRES